MSSDALKKAALFALVFIVLCAQCYRGVTFSDPNLPPGRSQQLLSHDFRWLYVAGKAWVQHESPHVPATFRKVWQKELGRDEAAVFPSPPTAAVLSVPVALFGWTGAHVLYDTFNVAAFLLTFVLLWRICQLHRPEPPAWRMAGALAVAALCSAVPAVIYTGQTSIIVTLGVTGMVYGVLTNRLWAAACWMVLASIKPQLSLLPFLWLCVWRPGLLPRAIVAMGAVVAGSLVLGWDPGFLSGMLESLSIYRQLPFNRLELSTPLYRWLAPAGLASIGPLLAVAVTLVLARTLRRADHPAVHGIPMLLTALLLPIHPYDQVVLMIPFVMLVALTWSWWHVPALVLALRPNLVSKALELAGFGPSVVPLVYALWVALFVCLAVLLWTMRGQFSPLLRERSPAIGAT